MHTLGGAQEVTFLTEKGLYKVLFRSRKPIAQKFQNWVCEVVKEIRLTGIYKMQTEINKAIEEKNKIREKTLIEHFPSNVQCVYYGTIDNNSEKGERLIKFGNSNNLRARILQHKETYENFRLVNAFKVGNKCEIETAIKLERLRVQLEETQQEHLRLDEAHQAKIKEAESSRAQQKTQEARASRDNVTLKAESLVCLKGTRETPTACAQVADALPLRPLQLWDR
jgi:hypothetical protein